MTNIDNCVEQMISIVTPTYNRKEDLQKAYESILCNNSRNFVWIIIDDGSNDGTESLVASWIKEKKIKIKYTKQPNGGVTRARQAGNEQVRTKWITWLDSDDCYKVHAIDMIIYYIKKYNEIISKKNCAGLMFPFEINGKYEICSGFHTLTELYFKKEFVGEYIQVMKTDIRNRFPDPVFFSETFLPESAHLRKIDRYYNFLCIKRAIAIRKYEQDGLTRNINNVYKNNPYGQAYALKVDSVYGRDMGILKQAQAYSDYKNHIKNSICYDKDIFPEIEPNIFIKILSEIMFSDKGFLSIVRCVINYPFPIRKLGFGKKIILYGAGNMGKAFMNQIKMFKLCKVVLWVDNMYETKRSQGLKVVSPECIDMYKGKYDNVIIAVKSKSEKKIIIKQLEKSGIKRNIII